MTTRDKDLQRRMEEIGQEMLEDDMIGEEEFEECMTRLRSLGSCNVGVTLPSLPTTRDLRPAANLRTMLLRIRLGVVFVD